MSNTPSEGPAAILIRRARERMMLSQTELAQRLGVPQQTVSRWENGTVEPSFENVLRAVGAAGWDLLTALMPQEKLPPKSQWPHRKVPAPTKIRPASIELLGADDQSLDESAVKIRKIFKQQRADLRRKRGDERPKPRRRG
jgi:DNA-binding XRE family transcriptional regulator